MAPQDDDRNVKSIERVTSNAFERELIEKAENYYPPRDSVLAAIDPWLHDTVPETGYWWWGRYIGVYLPFAVTIDAIEYNESFIDSLRASGSSDTYETARLNYSAEVSYHDIYNIYEGGYVPLHPEDLVASFEDVYIVRMRLSFGFECHVHCLLAAGKNRIAVFDREGNLVFVHGDGLTPVIVA